MRFYYLFFFMLTELFANDPYAAIKHYTLDNGMQVYLLPDKEAQNTNIIVDVKVGMQAEDEDNAGISHLVEHIVFRDQRIKDSDYYNLIQDKGATFINGYTSYKKTQFIATIAPENAYWLAKTFSDMLFDKNVTEEDLEIEKGALQIEIGEPTWVDRFLPDRFRIFDLMDAWETVFPPSPDVFERDFGIDPHADKKEYQSEATYKFNNKILTLDAVMAHYHDYYYPANMTLKIVGKFNLTTMQQTIASTFGKIQKGSGKTVKDPILKDATLNDASYTTYEGGMEDSSTITLGAKLLTDDPKKAFVMDIYISDLADRLNKKLRNKNGETYGVSGYLRTYHNAAIAKINFSTPHDVFDKNLAMVRAQMYKEGQGDINDSVILNALSLKDKHYDAIEHDVNSLMRLVNKYEDFQKFYGDDTQNPYQVFKSITPQYFKSVLLETFVPKRSYQSLQRDYRWFPYEGIILSILLLLLYLYAVYKFFGANVNKRKVKCVRRLSNPMTTFTIKAFAIFLSFLAYAWLIHLLVTYTPIDMLWAEGYDIPFSYLIMIVDALILIGVTYFIIKKVFAWFYNKIYISHGTLTLVGARSKYAPIETIQSFEVVPWSPFLWGKIHGVSLFFWKPLLKVNFIHQHSIYFRSYNAQHLHEDLELMIETSPDITKKYED